MQKRLLAIILIFGLLALSGCSKGLKGSEWKVAGSVDALGNELNIANANNAVSSLTIAFIDDKTGALRMEGTSYAFTYKQDKDITVTLQDGQVAKMTTKGDKIYLSIGDKTLFFKKK